MLCWRRGPHKLAERTHFTAQVKGKGVMETFLLREDAPTGTGLQRTPTPRGAAFAATPDGERAGSAQPLVLVQPKRADGSLAKLRAAALERRASLAGLQTHTSRRG